MKPVIVWALSGAYFAAIAAMFLAAIWSGDARWGWTGSVFLMGTIVVAPTLAALYDPDAN